MSSKRSSCSLLFDLDHTLCFDHHLEERVIQDLGSKHCKRSFPDEEVRKVLEGFRSGEVFLADALEALFNKIGCGINDVLTVQKEFEYECVQRAKDLVTPLPFMQDIMERLMALGVGIAVFSNGWIKLQQAKAKVIGFSGPVIVSEEIDLWKPDPRAFQLALERANFSKEKTAYVGDSPETDIVGAKQAGLKAIWVNLEGKTYPQGLVYPDFVITSLKELPELIFALKAL